MSLLHVYVAYVHNCALYASDTTLQDMLRVNPVSLNKISYDSVVSALETIRDIKPSPPIVGHVYVDTGEDL